MTVSGLNRQGILMSDNRTGGVYPVGRVGLGQSTRCGDRFVTLSGSSPCASCLRLTVGECAGTENVVIPKHRNNWVQPRC